MHRNDPESHEHTCTLLIQRNQEERIVVLPQESIEYRFIAYVETMKKAAANARKTDEQFLVDIKQELMKRTGLSEQQLLQQMDIFHQLG